ncbi:MAG TPA: exosortase A [Gammaproteobacteria bacterium]|nr:exosortase A [Gammaproteobacteria bacterium]
MSPFAGPIAGPFAAYALLVVAIGVLYWPSVASLWARWQPDPSYSHGWLIFVISGWLIWREARAGRLNDGRPSMLGVIALLGLGGAWLLAMAGSISVVQWLLLPALMFAAAFALFGWTALRRLWFPLGFTLFAIPFWNWLGPILQAITVEIVGSALMILRIPALLDGNRVHLPSGSFEIVEGCSGMHFFMVSMTLASLYGWLWFRRLKPTLALIGMALAMALLANWLRVFLVIYAGYLTEMQHFLVQVDHYYFGWAMYMLMMVPALFVAQRLEAEAGEDPAPAPAGTSPAPVHAYLASALLALGMAPVAWFLLNRAEAQPAPVALPSGQAGWSLDGLARPDWEPRYRGADATISGGYWRDGQGVDVWIVYYERPAMGSDVANRSNSLASRSDGRLRVSGREAVLDSGSGQRLIRYTHIIGGRESTGALDAKMHQIVATLSGQPEAALLAVSTPCGGDCGDARALLAAFEQDMGGPLRAAVNGQAPGTGQQ